MFSLQDFEEVSEQECGGFKVDQEVLPQKADMERVGVIKGFLRNKQKPDVFLASVKWKFIASGSSGANYQLLTTIKPKGEGHV